MQIADNEPFKEEIENALAVGDTLKVTKGQAMGLKFTIEKVEGTLYTLRAEDDQAMLLGGLEKKLDETKKGRNGPCPCGSGKKYKFCCGPKHR